MFLYHDIQWRTSDTTIGFNAGDGFNYYTVPDSTTADGVLNLDSTSNVGIPGIYIYRVDQDPCTYRFMCMKQHHFEHSDIDAIMSIEVTKNIIQ